MARYALIIVCTKTFISGPRAINDTVGKDMSKKWVDALSELGDLSFSWPGSTKARVLFNPTRGNFTDLLDSTDFKPDDEFLFYYFGHSYPVGPSKIAPVFDKSSVESLKQNDFQWVLTQIFDQLIGKVYAILDTCHSGLLIPELSRFYAKIYCMVAAENGYTKGMFSNHLLKGLSSDEDDIRKLLHDNQAGGLTFNSLFEFGLDQMESELDYGLPKAVGGLGDCLIRKGEQGVPSALRTTARERSSYQRTYCILKLIADGAGSFDELMDKIEVHDAFIVRHTDSVSGKRVVVSAKTIQGYLKFLGAIKFLKDSRSPFRLTQIGRNASSQYEFNGLLVAAILENLFPSDVDLSDLQKAVLKLLAKGTPSDSINVARYLRAQGSHRVTDPQNFKLGFRVLGYSGVFRRAPQSLFPI